jgi:hypothetical protein
MWDIRDERVPLAKFSIAGSESSLAAVAANPISRVLALAFQSGVYFLRQPGV